MSRYSKKQAVRERKRKLFIQRLMGIGMFVVCVFLFLIASHGQTVEERDITALVLFFPLSLWMIFSRNVLIY